MNYFEELKGIKELRNFKKQLISDYTYEVFEEEVIKSIPEWIEIGLQHMKEKGKASFWISFALSIGRYDETLNCEIATLSIHGKTYKGVNPKDFMQYVETLAFSIGALVSSKRPFDDFGYYLDIPTENLIEFYYGLLQSEEYQTGKSR